MNSIRAWIFRGLTLTGLGMLFYTWFQPWWVAYIETLDENGATIFPYQMVISGTLRDYPQWIVGYEMPVWFWPAMWIYLATMVGLLIYSLFLTSEDRFSLGKIDLSLPQVLVGIAGLLFVTFVVVFPLVISLRAPQFHGVPLQGNVFISMNEHTESYVITSLQNGYWIGCVTAGLLMALGLFRKQIVGDEATEQEMVAEPGFHAS